MSAGVGAHINPATVSENVILLLLTEHFFCQLQTARLFDDASMNGCELPCTNNFTFENV